MLFFLIFWGIVIRKTSGFKKTKKLGKLEKLEKN